MPYLRCHETRLLAHAEVSGHRRAGRPLPPRRVHRDQQHPPRPRARAAARCGRGGRRGRSRPRAACGAAKRAYEQIFIQKVNLWRRHPVIARVRHAASGFGGIAARLAGKPVRVWHDQALFKDAARGRKRRGTRTPTTGRTSRESRADHDLDRAAGRDDRERLHVVHPRLAEGREPRAHPPRRPAEHVRIRPESSAASSR